MSTVTQYRAAEITGQHVYMPTHGLPYHGLVNLQMSPLPVVVGFCGYFKAPRANEYENAIK